MKRIFLINSLLLLFVVKSSLSQSLNCADAANQLQAYAVQVNQIYNAEYSSIIPNQRCPAFDALGRPFNPVMVQNCRLQLLGYLNNWYSQQCNYVNYWYVQIVKGCTNKQTPNVKPDKIDEDEIEDLTAGVDEDKAVKITIPKTPAGFKPRK